MAETKLERVEVSVSPAELEKIDTWRVQLGIGSRSEAIRRLIKLGLKASDGDGEPTPIITP